MWMMEYCRDEGIRKYWNDWSEPYHKEGDDLIYMNFITNGEQEQFDRMAAESQSIPKGQAYLHVPTERMEYDALKMVFEDDGSETSITKVYRLGVTNGDDGYYTLDGKRVSAPGQGLYIHNGKKTLRTSSASERSKTIMQSAITISVTKRW